MACQREQACWASLTLLLKLLSPLPLCGCGFGNLHSIVCQICNGDEICPLALRQRRGVNKHRRDTRGKKHFCSIWANDGLVWAGLQTPLPPLSCPPPEKECQRQYSLIRLTPLCLCSCVYFLCVVCSVLSVRLWGSVPSTPAIPVLTVKTISRWWMSTLH